MSRQLRRAGYHRRMTDASATATGTAPDQATRPYSPGLEGVIAGETSLSLVDGERGRLLYRGYRIGDLVAHGTYPAVANLLWTGEWDPSHRLPTAPIPPAVMTVLRAIPASTKPMDALRTAVSAWGATQDLPWPPTVEQARALTSFSPSALAAFARLRAGKEPIEPDPSLDLVEGFLYQLNGERPDAGTRPGARRVLHRRLRARLQRLDVHRPGHHLDPLGHRVGGRPRAIGTMKGPLHGGAPSEVVDQLSQVGSPEHAEEWVRDALDRGERLMGFGHRVYRAYDPRAAALRKVAEGMEQPPEWLELAIEVEDVVLRVLAEKHPERAAQDQRRVLRRARPDGRRPRAGPLPGHVLAVAPRRLDGPRPRAVGRQPADPPGRQLHRARGARPPGLVGSDGRCRQEPAHPFGDELGSSNHGCGRPRPSPRSSPCGRAPTHPPPDVDVCRSDRPSRRPAASAASIAPRSASSNMKPGTPARPADDARGPCRARGASTAVSLARRQAPVDELVRDRGRHRGSAPWPLSRRIDRSRSR